jgi:hypothetical protein
MDMALEMNTDMDMGMDTDIDRDMDNFNGYFTHKK